MQWLQQRLSLDSGPFDTVLFQLAGTPVTVSTLIVFVLIIAGTFLASLLIQKAVLRAAQLRKIKNEGLVEVVRRLMHYVMVATGIAVGLQTIGINLSALFAASAVFAIGLGFAMQNIMQNFVSGVILLTERTIKPGDVLRIDQQLVRVQKMGIRATIARTLDEEEIIIPNSAIVQANVTNYTLRDSVYRLRTTVGVAYGSDMRRVRSTLEQVGQGISWRLADREPVVNLLQFGSSSVDWELSVWMDDPWRERQARSAMNEAVWYALKDAEIVIAFPQLDVHFDAPAPRTLSPAAD